MSSIEQELSERAAARDNRPIYLFTVPPKIAAESGVSKIGLVELLGSEELTVTKRAHGENIAAAFELAKESLRRVDNKKVSTFDGSTDKFWETTKPALRLLILQAYNSIHQPSQDELQAFLGSREVQV